MQRDRLDFNLNKGRSLVSRGRRPRVSSMSSMMLNETLNRTHKDQCVIRNMSVAHLNVLLDWTVSRAGVRYPSLQQFASKLLFSN